MKFVMNRDMTIASVFGHAIEFKKGEPTLVPKRLYAEVIAAGGVAEEELTEADLGKAPAGDERKAQILAAMTKILERSERDDFTAQGVPHPRVVSELCGFNVGAKERDAMWAELQGSKDD
jgi:hypothetical protein